MDGKAFQVILHAFKKNPVKNGLITGPWHTLQEQLVDCATWAGANRDSIRLQQILQTILQIDSIPFIIRWEQQFLNSVYLANAGDSLRFVRAVCDFADEFIMNVDTGKLFQLENEEYEHYLRHSEIRDNSNDNVQKIPFYGNCRWLFDALGRLRHEYEDHYALSPEFLRSYINWQERMADLYEHFPDKIMNSDKRQSFIKTCQLNIAFAQKMLENKK
ncbi:MAG: hypothetical protein LBR67_10310 [Dysgonamonadaceae bacterium]|nr:hypothetical protein [Dysgonamonadaceae bacterium]